MTPSAVRDALVLSLIVASVATTAVAILGTALGRHLARARHPVVNLIDALAMLPLFLPPTVLGYYLTLLMGRRGIIGGFLSGLGIEVTFTWIGAVMASGVVAFPLMVRSARTAFEGIGREVEESAAIDGASRAQRWRHILLPLARSGLMGGIVLSFARAIGEFGATLMVAGNIPGRTQTMPLAIYEAFTVGDDGTAATLSLILTGVSIVVVLIGLQVGRRGAVGS